ncbi:MAG: response regulator [Thermodesulfobacteriota bacterium]
MPKRILIVDYRVEVQNLLEATLKTSGHKILKAGSGAQAIEIAKKERPHVILMDVTLPGPIDGNEATRLLKSDPATQSCSVVMVTGRTGVEDKEKAISAGADAYFSKPFSPLELLTRVQRMLEE